MRPNPSERGQSARTMLSLVVLLILASTAAAQLPIPGLEKAKKRDRLPFIALKVGMVHPISGPPIENGVILIQKGKIKAIGKQGEVRIPTRAQLFEYPNGHTYPGLIDAQSTAFCPPGAVSGSSPDAGSEIGLVLDAADPSSKDLVQHGVTTAYVGNRGTSTWRGIGTVVRPEQSGFGRFKKEPKSAVHLRMTSGPGPSHALTRRKSLARIGKAFDSLDSYAKSLKKYGKKLEKYEEEFDEYIEFHEKKNGKGDDKDKKDTKSAKKPSSDAKKPSSERKGPPRGGRRGPRGRRPRPDAEGAGEAKPAPKKPSTAKKPESGDKSKSKDKGKTKSKSSEKEPKRPKFPKPPRKDPAKDALIDVREGNRTLRVEAHRIDEVRAALDLKREQEVDTMVLEGASAAGTFASELAENGVAVVLTDVEHFADTGYTGDTCDDLVSQLGQAKVTVAIGSGNVRRARHLPLIAARAAALGLGPEAAVRAITLTPAEILGVADHVGSLEPGKIADVLVTAAPLLHSDGRILNVIAGGRSVFEAK